MTLVEMPVAQVKIEKNHDAMMHTNDIQYMYISYLRESGLCLSEARDPFAECRFTSEKVACSIELRQPSTTQYHITMRNVRAASQALRLAGDSSRQQYVCRACLAQASRQLHTSPRTLADVPWWKRMQESVFGSDKSKKDEASREQKRKTRLANAPQREKSELETKIGAGGKEYVIAEVVDTYTHNDYVVSQTWDGLESIGSEAWVRQRADMGEQYQG